MSRRICSGAGSAARPSVRRKEWVNGGALAYVALAAALSAYAYVVVKKRIHPKEVTRAPRWLEPAVMH